MAVSRHGESEEGAEKLAPPQRRISLHRTVCTVSPARISVRPAPSVIVGPLLGVCLSLGIFTVIGLYINDLPFGVLAVLLVLGVIFLPFSAMGLVYSIAGANVVFDRRKQSASWHQGVMGLGIGMREVVPFWKIAEIVVEEAGHGEEAEGLLPVEEFAQWQAVLVKTSGKRLVIGGMTAQRGDWEWARDLVVSAAEAVVGMTGAPLHIEEPELLPLEEWEDGDDFEDGEEVEGGRRDTP